MKLWSFQELDTVLWIIHEQDEDSNSCLDHALTPLERVQ